MVIYDKDSCRKRVTKSGEGWAANFRPASYFLTGNSSYFFRSKIQNFGSRQLFLTGTSRENPAILLDFVLYTASLIPRVCVFLSMSQLHGSPAGNPIRTPSGNPPIPCT